MYADKRVAGEINNEFSDFVWVCADVKSILVNNDVFTMSAVNSTSFGMVVNTCTAAKAIDKE